MSRDFKLMLLIQLDIANKFFFLNYFFFRFQEAKSDTLVTDVTKVPTFFKVLK